MASNQKFYVAADRTIHGPVTNRKRATNPRNGMAMFTGSPLRIYKGGEELPSSFVDYATSKKETNGQTLLQNLIDGGYVVFNHGDRAPELPPAMVLPVERALNNESVK